MYVPIHLRVPGIRESVPATLVNLSGGGCQVNAAILVQTRLPVAFNLTRPGMTDLSLRGTIKKIRHAKQDHTFHYGIAFLMTSEHEREALLGFISQEQLRAIQGPRHAASLQPAAPRRLLEQRACIRTLASFPVRYVIPDQPGTTYEATSLDVSTGGMRIVTDRILRRDVPIEVKLSLPNDVLRIALQFHRNDMHQTEPFVPLSLRASALPGIRNSRGRYVHSLAFHNPSAAAIDEILRFIQANELGRPHRSNP